MPAAKILPIKPLGVSGTESLHGLFQIDPPASDKNMVMIIHQHVCEYVHLEPLGHLTDSFQETVAIIFFRKNIAAIIASRQQVIQSALVLNSPQIEWLIERDADTHE